MMVCGQVDEVSEQIGMPLTMIKLHGERQVPASP